MSRVQAGMSRRGLLAGVGLGGLGLTGLAGCSTPGAQLEPGECPSTDLSGQEAMLNFSNWPAYVDPPTKAGDSTLQVFEAESGVSVSYDSDINSNEEYFAKIAPLMSSCRSIDTDIFVLTDWMAAKMIELNWVQELDRDAMPNVQANLGQSWRSPAWDPERRFSVPWQSGMTGICYNSELVDPVESFDELLHRPDLKGRMALLAEMRDTMIFALLCVGADPMDFDSEEYDRGLDLIGSAVESGQVRKFTGNDYIQLLQSGDVAACEAWSGDVWQLGGKFKWVPAREGISFWTDNMLVPNLATHKGHAEKLMDFYYDAEVAAQLAAWNYYVTPVDGAQQQMKKFDKSAVQNPLIFPPPSWQERFYDFMPLGPEKSLEYQKKFNKVMGG